MARISVRRLLRAFVPFSLMVLSQRGLLLLFGFLNMTDAFAALAAFVPSAVLCAIVFFLIKNKSDEEEEYEEIPPLTKKGAAASIFHTAVAFAALVASMYAVSALLEESLADEVTLSVFSVISLIFIHPIIEEYIFRGLIYGEMRKMNPVFATLAQAVMFAIVHNTVNGMLYALVAGIILSLLVEMSGRITMSVLAHMIINARSLLYMTVLADKKDLTNSIDIMVFVLGAISLVGLAVIRGLSDLASDDAAVADAEEGTDGEILEVQDDEE